MPSEAGVAVTNQRHGGEVSTLAIPEIGFIFSLPQPAGLKLIFKILEFLPQPGHFDF
jgi:hypothetical protein